MIKTIAIASLAAFSCMYSLNAQAGSEELPADIVTGLMPAIVYAVTHHKQDKEGQKQYLRSTGASLVINNLLRLGFNQTDLGRRPNGSPYGFPSGHTGFVVSHAAFFQDRYGWKYGLPMYALSAYVANNRVETDHHRWRDIAAATLVSYSLSKLFVTPENATTLAPVIGPDWLGLRWQRSF